MTEFVELSVPAAPVYLSMVRLNTGSIATRMDVTLDALEDLQLAVDELCLSLLGSSPVDGGRILVRVEWDDDAIEIRCRLSAAAPRVTSSSTSAAPGLPASLSRQILDALVDEHGVAEEDGAPVAWLRKRRETALPPR